MTTIVRNTAFEPLLTAPLLYLLTRASPSLRSRILSPLTQLPYTRNLNLHLNPKLLVPALKWLLALGVLRRVNSLLTGWARNGWSLKRNAGGAPWGPWDREVMVITGGSGGIATELIKRLAPTGMGIAVLDLQEPGEVIKAYNNVHFYHCDITSSTSVSTTATTITDDLGTPTILINNAGIGSTHLITETPDTYLDKIFRVNLLSHWYTVRAFLPAMLAAKKGHVITTASMASYTSVAGMTDYCATKAGALSFHEGLTQELKHRYEAPYVRTTAICPFWVKTPLIKDWVEASLRRSSSIGNPILEPEMVARVMAEAVLKGRSGHVLLPDDVGMRVAALARGLPAWVGEGVNDLTKEHTRVIPVPA
ncbi:MAG: hypothetical protein M1831_001903 [Alyxoria varia]|nr:MAG: hypothetical protein M1831_001903 [Alyxoria varia]